MQNIVGAHSPNAAFWSMAVEAQLYLLFPLLLLMVRRWSAVVMLATVTLVVAAVGIFGPHISRLDTFVIQSPPDLAALFAVGILSAGIVGASTARRSWPWAWLALAAAVPVLATIWWQGSVWTLDHLFWVDLALGPAVACLLAGLATGRPAPLLRLLDTRPIRNLGSSSYSLYLTHAPIVVLVYERIVAGRVPQGVPAFVVTLVLVLPLTIAFARVFASVFEIPFLSHRGSPADGGTPAAPRPRGARMSRSRVGVGPPRGPRRGARRAGLAPRHRPVPRRHPHDRRPGARGSGRDRGADHGVLCLAVEARGPRSRRRVVPVRRGGRVLPLAVPQRHAPRRDRRATSTAGSATVATSAMSAARCGPSRGNASPGRSCRPS